MSALQGFLIICALLLCFAGLVALAALVWLDHKRTVALRDLPAHPPEQAERPYVVPYIVDLPPPPPEHARFNDMDTVTPEQIAAALARTEEKRNTTLTLELLNDEPEQ